MLDGIPRLFEQKILCFQSSQQIASAGFFTYLDVIADPETQTSSIFSVKPVSLMIACFAGGGFEFFPSIERMFQNSSGWELKPMTNAEKVQIARLRGMGLGYTQIANRLGLSKGTVGTFCRRNGLGEAGTSDGKNNLLSEPVRVNTDTTTTPEAVEIRCSRPSEVTCSIRVEYADKPDETAVADVIEILRNAMRKE